jgi:hypothetical protein
MNFPYDITNTHCICDSPENGFELPLETRISDLATTTEANADEFGLELPFYDRANVEMRLYNIFVAWMEKNNVYYDFLAAGTFLEASKKHDNHKWLYKNISS